jgi:branched-chain amino acid transport system ATP-binding protein
VGRPGRISGREEILLEFREVSKTFGGLQAVASLSFEVGRGEIVGLIGPNGAGKSTVFNLATGAMKPDTGRVIFKGQDITGFPPYATCRCGVARTFQLVRTFNRLTALQNVMAGRAYGSQPAGSIKEAQVEAEEILEITGLADKRMLQASTLGLVDRKRLEIARALATKPQLLLLDEMFAGLNGVEIDEAIAMTKGIRDRGVTLIVVEHVMKVIMGISDRIVVMAVGRKIADCLPRELMSNEQVVKAYLGNRIVC